MSTSDDIRSLRTWLNSMYPDAPIHLQRNAAKIGKPYFYLEHVDDRFTDRGRGWHDVLRTFNIHLVTEGNHVNSPTSDIYWKTREVLDYLQNRLLEERVVQHYFYNLAYPTPGVTLRAGGSFTPGTRDFAVTALCGDQQTLISPHVTINVTSSKKVFVLVPHWPTQNPIADSYRVWTRVNSAASWICVKEGALALQDGTIQGASSTELQVTSLTNLNRTLSTTCRIPHGGMKVQEAAVTLTESIMLEDAFHGALRFKMFCHSYHHRPGTSILSDVAVSTTIN